MRQDQGHSHQQVFNSLKNKTLMYKYTKRFLFAIIYTVVILYFFMNTFTFNALKNLIVIFSLTVVFIFFLFILNRIKTKQESMLIVKNSFVLKQGLDYFFEDNERFPTSREFLDPNVFGIYISPFPLKDFKSQECEQTWEYKRLSLAEYKLDFCLRSGFENYKAGWNQLSFRR